MKRFIRTEHLGQGILLPESFDDYVSDTTHVRVVDLFVDDLDLVSIGMKVALNRYRLACLAQCDLVIVLHPRLSKPHPQFHQRQTETAHERK
jgi:hypothetical protein